jgi:hypothetical protein
MLGGNDGDGHYINTVARQCGIRVGDIIVAINGIGYRRFQIDYHVEEDDDNDNEVITPPPPPPPGVVITDFKNHSSSSSEAEEEVEEKVGEREALVDEEEPEAGEVDEAKVGEALLEEEEEDEAFYDAIDAGNVEDDNNDANNNSTKEVDNNDNIAGHEFNFEGSEEEYLASKYLANTNNNINQIKNEEDSNQHQATTSTSTTTTVNKQKDIGRVIHSNKVGESYNKLLLTIRNIKCNATADHPTNNNNNNPLSITLERYGWDTRVHSWSRFVSANNGNVPMAMSAIQSHERWRSEFFPIDLTEMNLQHLLNSHAVSIIDPSRRHGNSNNEGNNNHIDEQQLMIGPDTDTLLDNVVRAFVIYTETLLSNSPDPRCPTTSQFVDLSGVSLRDGLLRTPGMLKKLYAIFEPNYPETLDKMILYPVPKLMVRAVNAMLSFVNHHTRKKFILTDDMNLVCNVLGWDKNEIDRCGGTVNSYMKENIKYGGISFAFD